jgi:F-box domain
MAIALRFAHKIDTSSHLSPNTIMQMSWLDILPIELILQLFAHFDLPKILSLRQLCKRWNRLIQENPDVFRFLINQPHMTFRGAPLSSQLESKKALKMKSYEGVMKHLSSRLHGLHADGPGFTCLIPLEEGANFGYGSKLLALEKVKGELIEVKDIYTLETVTSISISDILGEGKLPRAILSIRIRDSILAISVHDIPEKGPYGDQKRGCTTLLFISLVTNPGHVLRKIRRGSSHQGPDYCIQEGLDFNATRAVTFRNYDFGTLYMGNQQVCTFNSFDLFNSEGDILEIQKGIRTESFCLSDDNSLTALEIKQDFDMKENARWSIKTILEEDEYVSEKMRGKTMRYSIVRHVQISPELYCVVSHEWTPIFGQSRRATVSTVVRVSAKTREVLSRHTIANQIYPSLGSRLFVNHDAEYVFAPHVCLHPPNNVSELRTSYRSLRPCMPNEEALIPPKPRQCLSFQGDEKVIWMPHDKFCRCPKRGMKYRESVTRRNPAIYEPPPKVEIMANFGDEEYICARTKKGVAIFKFDRCID